MPEQTCETCAETFSECKCLIPTISTDPPCHAWKARRDDQAECYNWLKKQDLRFSDSAGSMVFWKEAERLIYAAWKESRK